MARIYKSAAVLFGLVAVALFAGSLLLVPESRALADEPAGVCSDLICEGGCIFGGGPQCTNAQGQTPDEWCQIKTNKSCTDCECKRLQGTKACVCQVK